MRQIMNVSSIARTIPDWKCPPAAINSTSPTEAAKLSILAIRMFRFPVRVAGCSPGDFPDKCHAKSEASLFCGKNGEAGCVWATRAIRKSEMTLQSAHSSPQDQSEGWNGRICKCIGKIPENKWQRELQICLIGHSLLNRIPWALKGWTQRMRSSVAAIALIRRETGGQALWLARWNSNWNAFSFVGGHKEEDETFRECLIREVTEELGLEPDADFVVAEKAHSHLEYIGWSDGARAQTAYTMELYPLELTGDFSHEKIDSDPENRWLEPAEIQAYRTKDGKAVSGTMALLLEMAGLLEMNPP
jgi:8-oxo-dGTP pyrophosphatase MutT (NUDIX family)